MTSDLSPQWRGERRGASGVTSCQGNRQDVRMGLQLIFGWRNSLPANLALAPSSSSILQVRGHRSQSVCFGFIGLFDSAVLTFILETRSSCFNFVNRPKVLQQKVLTSSAGYTWPNALTCREHRS